MYRKWGKDKYMIRRENERETEKRETERETKRERKERQRYGERERAIGDIKIYI